MTPRAGIPKGFMALLASLRGLAVGLAACVTLAWPAAALAGPDEDRRAAERLSEEGIQFARQRRFNDAVARFEAALKLHPHPVTMHNLGRAWEALGNLPQAWDYFSRALAEDYAFAAEGRQHLDRIGTTLARDHARVTVRVTPSNAKVVFSQSGAGLRTFVASPFSTWIKAGPVGVDVSHSEFRGRQEAIVLRAGDSRELEYVLQPLPRLGFLRVSVNVPGALVMLSGRSLGRAPLEALTIESGAYQLEVQAPGFQPFVKPITVTHNQQTEVAVALEAGAGFSGSVNPEVSGTPSWVGWSFIATGLVAAGGGLGMYLHASSEAEALDALYEPPAGEDLAPEREAAYQQAFDSDIRPWITGYTIVFSAAGALALTGAALLVFDPEGEALPAAAATRPTFIPALSVAPQGVSLGGTLRF